MEETDRLRQKKQGAFQTSEQRTPAKVNGRKFI
jgi:hypothetical protein